MDQNTSPEMILKKAIGYIVSVQGASGAWSRLEGEFPFETEPTSWAVTVLAMNGKEPDRVARGVEFILGDQEPDGSWNNNSAHTGFAVIALKHTEAGDEAVEKAIAYFRGAQGDEGGFRRTADTGDPTTLHTAIVLFAMKEAGMGIDDPMVHKAIGWLKGCRNEDGGYGVTRGSASVAFGTARVVKALLIFGASVAEPSVRDGILWLLSMQKESGGFSMTQSAPEDPEITAYALTVLCGLGGYEEATKKAITYLAKVQHEDGSYTSYAPIQFVNVAKKNTQTTCFVAWALSETGMF